jgi:hypothetical protein
VTPATKEFWKAFAGITIGFLLVMASAVAVVYAGGGRITLWK